jgi:hypothetical protein
MRALAVAVLASIAIPAVAAADTYTVVNEVAPVRAGGYIDLRIEGVVGGTTQTETYRVGASTSAGDSPNDGEICVRFATLAMSKPGRYQLTIVPAGYSNHRWPRSTSSRCSSTSPASDARRTCS